MKRILGLLLCLTPAFAAQIKTIAGTGKPGSAADGAAAVGSPLNNPYGLTIGPDGALYVCEVDNHRIVRIDLKTGLIFAVVGNGTKGYAGDGGPAVNASLNQPYEIRFDKAGNLFFVEMQNHVVRRVDAKTRIITTVAGTGKPGFSGDGGPANKAQLNQPHSIAFDPQGRLLICDIQNRRIRRVDLGTGIIETYAGTGERQNPADGAALEGAPFNGPRAIAVASNGDLIVVLREGNAVYRIEAATQTIHHFAGTGEKGNSGDGGPATVAKLNGPKGISVAPDGTFYIADTENHTIRRIDPRSGTPGTIATVAGTGERGDGPDGNPLGCQLSRPHGVFVAADGTVYIADSESHRIRVLK
jgi:DNA-binding beta-propeller fold protein YncE